MSLSFSKSSPQSFVPHAADRGPVASQRTHLAVDVVVDHCDLTCGVEEGYSGAQPVPPLAVNHGSALDVDLARRQSIAHSLELADGEEVAVEGEEVTHGRVSPAGEHHQHLALAVELRRPDLAEPDSGGEGVEVADGVRKNHPNGRGALPCGLKGDEDRAPEVRQPRRGPALQGLFCEAWSVQSCCCLPSLFLSFVHCVQRLYSTSTPSPSLLLSLGPRGGDAFRHQKQGMHGRRAPAINAV